MSEELEFFKRPEPITQCDETVECDVAVVGAGSPGVPCAIRAGELGMKVAVLQKESYASACGNFGAGILLDKRSARSPITRVSPCRSSPTGRRRICL